MGPMDDEDVMVTGAPAEIPVRSESQQGAGAGAEGGDQEGGVDERLAPGLEEAGYGYGV